MNNRFSAIAFEDDGSSFVELAAPSPSVSSISSASKKSQKNMFKDLQGSSSLEKVSHALKMKKQAEEEEQARKAAAVIAAAEKKAQDAIAAANAHVPLENTHRRTGKPNGHTRHEERDRMAMTPRQREHAYDRESRTYRKKGGDGEKKHGAGKGNWGKLVHDQDVTTLNPFPETPRKPVQEAPVVPVVAAAPVTETQPAAPAVVETPVPAEPPKPAVFTYEEYLAEKAKSSFVINVPRRKANEGNSDNVQWKKAVPLVKKEEDVYNFPGRKAEGELSHKPRPLQTSVPSITVDPRLNIDFSKPSYPKKSNAGPSRSASGNANKSVPKKNYERSEKAEKPTRT